MTHIIHQWDACDGHYVRVETGGHQIDLGFPTTPTTEQLNEKIALFEQDITDEIVATKIIESEEVDHGLRFI
jgi:hypothetical protein